MKQAISSMPLFIKICFIIVLTVIIGAIFASLISPYDPNAQVLLDRNKHPSFAGGDMANIFGTDELGRDIFSRLLYGAQVSIAMALVGLIFGSIIGVVLGLTSGYFGGWWDRLVMMAVNFQQSIPFTLVILIGVIIFGRGIPVLMIFIGIAKWESYTRFVRGLVLSLKEKQFIEAAQSYNASSFRIMFKHIFPALTSSLIVLITLNFPGVLLLESSLSFIGIGVQPPTATLGQMVGAGRNYLTTNPWIAVMPAIIIVILSYSVQSIGEWLRDKLDVKKADN
ncbi:ABC transporter permease [Ornithinibacillus sp. 4-3]|uniref:ABC transporter permease n=1 Tax=Ornithinibacillus sp. 4-3 TaxID=3231488 RepID=A0AB39HSR8_9BACI